MMAPRHPFPSLRQFAQWSFAICNGVIVLVDSSWLRVEGLNLRRYPRLVRKHRKLLILLACLAVIGVVVVVAARDDEPTCRGVPLSAWLQTADRLSENVLSLDARHAVRYIGTNAIPYLLKWIHATPTAWQKTARSKLPRSLSQSRFGRSLAGWDREAMPAYAATGFGILGTNAAAAIPELKSIMQDTDHPETAYYAIMALANIGAPALPTLTSAFSDKGYPLRYEILLHTTHAARAEQGILKPDDLQSLLRTALEDPKLPIRKLATNAALKIAPELLTNAPAK